MKQQIFDYLRGKHSNRYTSVNNADMDNQSVGYCTAIDDLEQLLNGVRTILADGVEIKIGEKEDAKLVSGILAAAGHTVTIYKQNVFQEGYVYFIKLNLGVN